MPFGSLWLPVLVSAVMVFVASSIVHMVIRHHKADYHRLPDEAGVGAVLRKLDPGLYVIPYCTDMSQMKDPAFAKKYEEGPVAMISILRKQLPPMGKLLTMWFGFCILVSFVTAYTARNTLTYGSDGMLVLRITTVVAFAGYGLGAFQDMIWKSIPLTTTLRYFADAVIYAVLTGLTFMFLWPAA